MPTCPNCGCFINQNLTQHLLYSNKCKKKSVKHTKENASPQIPNVIQFQSSAPSRDNVCKKRSMEDHDGSKRNVVCNKHSLCNGVEKSIQYGVNICNKLPVQYRCKLFTAWS